MMYDIEKESEIILGVLTGIGIFLVTIVLFYGCDAYLKDRAQAAIAGCAKKCAPYLVSTSDASTCVCDLTKKRP